MQWLGLSITAAAVWFFFKGIIAFGALVFVVGGFLAGGLHVSLRSLGFCLLVISGAYGCHHGFTPGLLFLMFAGFVFACFTTRRADSDHGWGFDFPAPGSRSEGDSCDGGGDGGGGD